MCFTWLKHLTPRPFRLCAVFSGFVPLFSASRPLSAPKAVAVFSFRASCPFSACVPFSASVPPPRWPSGLLLYSPVHVPTSLYAGFPSGWRVALGWLARGSCCVSRCWSARCGGRFSLGLLLALVGTAPLCARVCVRPCGFRWLACGNRTLLRVERKDIQNSLKYIRI